MSIETPNKKYFIITAGPTGSGKTRLVTETFKHLGIPEDSKFNNYLIDDLVENDELYKKNVKTIIDSVYEDCSNKKKIDKCVKKKFNSPTEDLYKQFFDAYNKSRKEGCESLKIKGEGDNCDDVLNNSLLNIKNEKPEIVIFESTGSYIQNWLFERNYITDEYEVIFSYSLVDLRKLIERNKKRAYDSVVNFYKDPSKYPAPRLPNVSEYVESIKTVLLQLYEKCVIPQHSQDSRSEICGHVQINRLLLFDNNGDKHLNIFDSNDTNDKNRNIVEFKKLVDDHFSTSLKSTISKKSKKSKKRNKTSKKSKKSKKRNKKSKKKNKGGTKKLIRKI